MKKGSKQSIESKLKMSESLKGHSVSPETREKLREIQLGRKRSLETREKISKALLGNKRHLGKHHSNETKEKLSSWIRTEEIKNKIGQKSRERWEDKDYRERMIIAHTGKKQTEESNRKRSEKLKGHAHWGGMSGKKHSSETKEKMKDSASKRRIHAKETYLEKNVREILEELNFSFVQEKYFKGIGAVDFYLEDYRLVIECDGEYWHSKESQKIKDAYRDNKLFEKNLKVLRLPEKIINEGRRTILSKIYDIL